jgi:ribosomal protein L12E/L44/L45/RPP1/RPP2
LIEAEVIDGNDLREIIETTSGKPQLVPGTTAEHRAGTAQTPNEVEDEQSTDAAAGQ